MSTAYCNEHLKVEDFRHLAFLRSYEDAPARVVKVQMECGHVQQIVRPIVVAAPYGGEDESHNFMTSESVG